MPKQWQWNEQRGQYRAPSGRYASSKDALKAADAYLQSKQTKTADKLFDLLRNGQLSVRDAQLLGEREIAKAHVVAAMAAKGGKSQMAFSDYGRVGGIVRQELAYFRDRMKAIAEGQPLDGRVKQSFRAFIDKARVTYITVERLEMQKRGWDLVKNIDDDGARHCTQCPEISALDFQPLGSFPDPGERECRGNCRCRLIYKNSATGEIRE